MTSKIERTRLYLIRHAEVEERYHQVFGGRIDMNLSSLGRQQAVHLANRLLQSSFQHIYASPMLRVQQTTDPLLSQTDRGSTILEGLKEVDFGDWTGHRWSDIPSQFGTTAYEWLNHLVAGTMRNAESLKSWEGRVSESLRQIQSQAKGQNALIYCHGGVIRLLLSILLNLELKSLSSHEIDYASVSVVDVYSNGRRILQSLNEVPWRNNPI